MAAVHNEPCPCWNVPLADSATKPAAWMGRHDTVALVTHSGKRIVGSPDALPADALPEDGLHLAVEDARGTVHTYTVDDVARVEPAPTASAENALGSVRAALHDHSALPEEGLYQSVTVTDHEYIEITVRRRTVPCLPSPRA